jgi:hypothetical protein
MKMASIGLAALLVAGYSSVCLAADDMVAEQQIAGSTLMFKLKPALANATLSVTGPNNFHTSTFSKAGALAIDLSESGPLMDGSYDYQLTASGAETVTDRTPLDNGRGKQDKAARPVSLAASGTFRVRGGAIVKPDATKIERDKQ